MGVKNRIVVIGVAMILITAGYFIYVNDKKGGISPTTPPKEESTYPPGFRVILDKNFTIPCTISELNNSCYLTCLGTFTVGNSVNFTGYYVNSNTTGLVCVLSTNKEINQNLINESVTCIEPKEYMGGGLVFGGNNNYKKSPRGEWDVKSALNGTGYIHLIIWTYAGNNSFHINPYKTYSVSPSLLVSQYCAIHNSLKPIYGIVSAKHQVATLPNN